MFLSAVKIKMTGCKPDSVKKIHLSAANITVCSQAIYHLIFTAREQR